MQKIRGYTSRRLFALAVLLCVACAAFIFSMSAETAEVSGDRSAELAEQILSAVFPDADETSEEWEETVSSTDHILRKAAHFCIYTVFGGLLCFASLGFSATARMHTLRSLAIGALYATSDEWHQAIVPGRGPAVSDVLLDSAGVLCGIALVILFLKCILKKQKNVADWTEPG